MRRQRLQQSLLEAGLLLLRALRSSRMCGSSWTGCWQKPEKKVQAQRRLMAGSGGSHSPLPVLSRLPQMPACTAGHVRRA